MTNHFRETSLLWSKFKEIRKLVSETPDAACLELLFWDKTPCNMPPSFTLIVEFVDSSETLVNLCQTIQRHTTRTFRRMFSFILRNIYTCTTINTKEYCGVSIKLHTFHSRRPMEVSGHFHPKAALLPRKSSQYIHLDTRQS